MPLDGVVFHDNSDYKRGRLFRHLQKSKYNGVVQFRDCVLKKIICSKVTKMGFIIDHKID